MSICFALELLGRFFIAFLFLVELLDEDLFLDTFGKLRIKLFIMKYKNLLTMICNRFGFREMSVCKSISSAKFNVALLLSVFNNLRILFVYPVIHAI